MGGVLQKIKIFKKWKASISLFSSKQNEIILEKYCHQHQQKREILIIHFWKWIKNWACPHGENWKINQKVISSESSPFKYAYISISGSFLKQKNGVKPKHPRFKKVKKKGKWHLVHQTPRILGPKLRKQKKNNITHSIINTFSIYDDKKIKQKWHRFCGFSS